MYIPRIQKEISILARSLFAIAVFYSNTVLAQGVLAGIDISNKVTVTYSIAGKKQSPIESSPTGNKFPGIGNGQNTTFKVDRKVDLTITNNGDTKVTLGESHAELNFTLSNDGNDSQEFLLSTNSILPTDNFNTHNCKVEITSVTGTPLPGVILPTFDTIKLGPDQQANISVKCDIPFDNDGQPILKDHTSLLSIKALTSKNSDGSITTEETTPESESSIETVYADTAGSDDIIRDASHSARASYITLDATTSALPTLSIDKTIVSVVDPQGGNKSVSGSNVTYKIIISTTGEGVINNVIITDSTPTNMTYKPNSILLNSSRLTDAADTDKGSFSVPNNVVTINLGQITAGSQQKIQLNYTIN